MLKRSVASCRKIATGSPLSPAWSPDSKWLLWQDFPTTSVSSLHVALAAGGDARQLLPPPEALVGGDEYPSLSPDGRQLVFVRVMGDKDSDLYVADFDAGRLSGAPRQLTHDHKNKTLSLWTIHDAAQSKLFISRACATSALSISRGATRPVANPKPVEGIGANRQLA